MTRILGTTAAFAYRRRFAVVGTWMLIVMSMLGLLVAAGGNDLTDEFSVPGSESQSALDTLAEEFPGSQGASVQILLEAPQDSGVGDPEYAPAVSAALGAVSRVDQVAAVIDPTSSGTVAPDGSVALAQVQLEVPATGLSEDTLAAIETAMAPAEDAGLDVVFGGSAYSGTPEEVGHTAEVAGVVLALAIMAVTLGSLVAAGLPLLTALIGVVIGLVGIWLASTVVTVSSTAPSLALMLGLAIGIDYALLIIVRHRAELARGLVIRDAVIRASTTAGSSVVFAGGTVIIGLLGLAVARVPFLTTMGIAAAATALVAVLVATTLLPAVLSIAGERLRPRARPATGGAAVRPPFAERWVNRVLRRPAMVLTLGVLALGALAIPVLGLQLALPDGGSDPEDSGTRQVYDTVAETFGAGLNGPLLVLADVSGSERTQAATTSIAETLRSTEGVARVAEPRPAPSGDYALIQVTPTTGPADVATADLVQEIRNSADTIAASTGAKIEVSGTTALNIDVSSQLSGSILPFALVVVGLSLLLLTLVFRSLLVPLVAALGYLLSLGAALGVTVAVFQWGWAGELLTRGVTGSLVSFTPVILMAVLFGLAMDYQIFLVTRIHEVVLDGRPARDAIGEGAGYAGRVVVAAALIMIGVFASFGVGGSATLAPVAFSLAVGVAADAFVVRMTLVPAALALLGERAWWLPAWAQRTLPRIDVEGTATAAVPDGSVGVP